LNEDILDDIEIVNFIECLEIEGITPKNIKLITSQISKFNSFKSKELNKFPENNGNNEKVPFQKIIFLIQLILS
jgi:hypothetical protein